MHKITFILLVIGGINWLLVGILGKDIFELIGLDGNIIATIVYILVGLSAIYEVATHKKNCRICGSGQAQV